MASGCGGESAARARLELTEMRLARGDWPGGAKLPEAIKPFESLAGRS